MKEIVRVVKSLFCTALLGLAAVSPSQTPAWDTYRGDEWVLFKHAQMPANAGVDVIVFDNSNAAPDDRFNYRAVLR